MPRTVEHIIACHQTASALREAGKPIWNKRIEIKAILAEDRGNDTPEHITLISHRIAALLRHHVPASYFDIGHENFDFDFVDVVEAMESCTAKELAEAKANRSEAIDMFNDWLETIYDWADVNRIWLGN